MSLPYKWEILKIFLNIIRVIGICAENKFWVHFKSGVEVLQVDPGLQSHLHHAAKVSMQSHRKPSNYIHSCIIQGCPQDFFWPYAQFSSHKPRWTDRRMDGCYQTYYLPCLAVVNNFAAQCLALIVYFLIQLEYSSTRYFGQLTIG